MKFRSVKEYFYKLNTIGFILLLLPLLVFILLYFQSIDYSPIMADQQSEFILLSSMGIIFLADLTIVHWVWSMKIGRLKKLIELAGKMDGYFSLALLRMGTFCGCSVLAAAGFFLTRSSWFTGFFLLVIIAFTFQWPSPSSFCRHFNLRGAEREMIMKSLDLNLKKRA